MAVAADEDDWQRGCGCVSSEDVVRLAVESV